MKRLLTIASTVVLATAVLASAAPPTAGASAVDTRTAKITIWHAYIAGSAEDWAFSQVLASVRPKFPNVTFTVVRQSWPDLYARFQADPAHGPDLLLAANDQLGFEVEAGIVRDVSAVMKTRDARLTPEARAGARYGGRYWMIPQATQVLALVVRDSRVPDPPSTTAELLAAVQGGLKLGFVADAYFPFGFYSGFDGRVVDSSYQCVADRTPGVADAMSFLRSLVTAGASAYANGEYYRMQAEFLAGGLDAVVDGNWIGGDYRKAFGDDVGVALLPAGPEGRSRPLVSVEGFVVNAKRPNGALATKVALAMTDPTAQKMMMDGAVDVPANAAIAVTDPLVTSFATAVRNGRPRPLGPAFGAYWTPFRSAMETVVFDGADADAAVRTACSAMNAANGR